MGQTIQNDKVIERQQQLVALRKELGVRNSKTLENSFRLTLVKQRENIKATKNGKKITIKRFLECCELRSIIKNCFCGVSIARHQLHNRYNHKGGRTNTKRNIAINRGDLGIKHAARKRIKFVTGFVRRHIITTSGSVSISVGLTKDPGKVSYVSETTRGEQYSRSCTWRKRDLEVWAVLPVNWVTRVYNQDFVVIDDMFTLDISTPLRVKTDNPDISVRAAKWLVHSRGSSFNVVDGFIGFYGPYSFHGKTLNSALRGVERKARIDACVRAPTNKIIEMSKKSTLLVHLSDSYAVGNCEWGTRDFCRRNGIDLNVGNPAMLLSELAAIAEKEPRREVVRVMAYKLAQTKDVKTLECEV